MKYITRTISGWNVTVTYKINNSEPKTDVFYNGGTEACSVRCVKRYMVNKLNVDSFSIDKIEHVHTKYRMSVDDFILNAEKIN